MNSSDMSNESSQDTESYEVIGKSDREGSADEASPIVETVGPKLDHGLKDLDAVDDEDDGIYEEDENEARGKRILFSVKNPHLVLLVYRQRSQQTYDN